MGVLSGDLVGVLFCQQFQLLHQTGIMGVDLSHWFCLVIEENGCLLYTSLFLYESEEEQKAWIAEHTAEITHLERRLKIMACLLYTSSSS